jgi:ERCC4-type nuclease
MELVYDYREKHVFKQLEKMVGSEKYNTIVLVSKNLDIGDFVIGNMIIERKTHQDLAASLLDGRYREQSARLVKYREENPNTKIIYFIEGNFDLFFNNHNVDKDKLISCIMSLMYEKNFYIITSKHINETCEFLLKFTLKYYTKYCNGVSNSMIDNCAFIDNKKHKKSTQITKDNIALMMLTNIPNVSENIARQILQNFDNNMYKFLNSLYNDSEILNDIKLKNKDNKERKLSKLVIKNIKELLLD